MNLAEAIFARLSAEGSYTSRKLGVGPGARLYPDIAPEGVVAPYAVQQQIAEDPETTLAEASASGIRLLQLSCVAATAMEARAVAAAITADLDNQTLANGAKVLRVDSQSGFSDATDQYLRLVEVSVWSPTDTPDPE